MQNWYPTSDENGLQKGPQKWAKILKMGSKSLLKRWFQKSIKTWWFSAPLNVAKVCKSHQNRWLLCSGLGSLLGLILEVFWEPKWRPRPSKSPFKKTSKKLCPTWSQTGPEGGPKMEPKSSKMRSWKHLVSRVAPKRPPDPFRIDFGEVLRPFWYHFRQCFWHMFDDFYKHSLATCCKQIRSKSQGLTKRMQQRASKKQLLSSCHLALKHSLANVNELSGPC